MCFVDYSKTGEPLEVLRAPQKALEERHWKLLDEILKKFPKVK